MIWQDTSEKYIGQWTDNFQNGLGIHIWYESKGEQKYLRNRYVGEWRNGFRHGYGVFFYANGGKYEGMWEQNYKNGYGVFTFYDGSQFAGKFTMDRMDYNNSGYLPAANQTRSTAPHNTTMSKFGGEKIGKGLNKKGETSTIKEEEEKTSNSRRGEPKEKKGEEKKIEEKHEATKTTKQPEKVESSNRKKSLSPTPTQSKSNLKAEPQREKKETIKTESKKSGSISKAERIESNQQKNQEKAVAESNTNSKKSIEPIDSKGSAKQEKKGAEIDNKNTSSKKEIPKSQRQEKNEPPDSNQSKNNSKKPSELLEQNKSGQKNEPNDEDKKAESKSVFTTKTVKESEQNPFKTLLDITDIIETEPDLESGQRDVENILLRYLSDMKAWYRYYSCRDGLPSEIDNSQNRDPSSKFLNKDKEEEVILDNNDIGFAMEMKDLWKFMRDSNMISIDFSLASFNRIYSRGPKNYIEMFLCPDEIKLYSKEYFDYIYQMIQKSRDDFLFKNRDKFLNSSNPNTPGQVPELSHLLLKPSEIEHNVDIHYKKSTVLLRQFFDSIVRMAYLKYFQSSEPLYRKIKMLIDNCIKTNPNIKKLHKKSNTHDSSLNSTLILDMKAKIFENSFDNFMKEHDSKLKKIFQYLFSKTTNSYKKTDQTITYKFFFENIIRRSDMFVNLFDRFSFVELMTIYHKDKMKINEDNMHSLEVAMYIENLFDCEMIFFEFCELVFFCGRKYCAENSINERKEKETFADIIKNFVFVASKAESIYSINERFVYSYPKLANHKKYEAIIEADKQRRMLEEKKRQEQRRLEMERNLLTLEDVNILPHDEVDEINEENSDLSDN